MKLMQRVMTGVALTMMVSSAASVNAASPDGDVFSTSTHRPAAPTRNAPIRGGASVSVAPRPVVQQKWIGPRPTVSPGSNPTEWFEAVDTYVSFFRPSFEDSFIVDRPFEQEVERVEEFCRTVVKISRNYRILAKRLAAMPLINSLPESRNYRIALVTWYNDQAALFEDMVRPRPPARTREELDGLLDDLKGRSELLKSQAERLQEGESKIRKKYGVHPPRYDDALHDYATFGMPNHIKKELDGMQH